jgi:hypothetical protein
MQIAACALLPLAVLAGCQIASSNSIVGHWRGGFPGKANRFFQSDIVFRPDGTETFTAILPGHQLTDQATYTIRPGIIISTFARYTEDGKLIPPVRYQILRYKATPTTLIFSDGTKKGQVVMQRVSP